MLTVEKDGVVEGCAFTSCKKSELAAEQPSKGGSWNPSKKDAPCPRTKGRRGAITFKKSNLLLARLLEGTKKALCAPGPGKGVVTVTRDWVRPARV